MREQAHGFRGWLRFAVLAWASLLVSGCGTLAVHQPPQLSLADLGLESIGLFEQRLTLSLRIQNPNGSVMEIKGLSCTLAINGQHFAQGVSSRPVRIPGYSDQILEVSANAGTGSILRQLQTLAQGKRETIEYRLQGMAQVSGLGQVPFDQVGDIPLLSLPAQPSQPRRGR